MDKIQDFLVGSYDLNINFENMFVSYHEVIRNYNLITDVGRMVVLNRLGANTINFISHMAIGTGTVEPLQSNTTLGTETIRKAVTFTYAGTPDWKITFNAGFTSAEINGSTEIGLLNASSGGNLCTRNVHTAISIPSGSLMTIQYSLGLLTGSILNTFTLTGGQTKTYELSSQVAVIGVIEKDTNQGYIAKTSIAQVEATAGSYYYDSTGKKLYIHTYNDANPNTHTIIGLYGG